MLPCRCTEIYLKGKNLYGFNSANYWAANSVPFFTGQYVWEKRHAWYAIIITFSLLMVLKNVLQFSLSYIKTMSQFHVLYFIFFLTGHFTRPILSHSIQMDWIWSWADINRNCNTFFTFFVLSCYVLLFWAGRSCDKKNWWTLGKASSRLSTVLLLLQHLQGSDTRLLLTRCVKIVGLGSKMFDVLVDTPIYLVHLQSIRNLYSEVNIVVTRWQRTRRTKSLLSTW